MATALAMRLAAANGMTGSIRDNCLVCIDVGPQFLPSDRAVGGLVNPVGELWAGLAVAVGDLVHISQVGADPQGEGAAGFNGHRLQGLDTHAAQYSRLLAHCKH